MAKYIERNELVKAELTKYFAIKEELIDLVGMASYYRLKQGLSVKSEKLEKLETYFKLNK
jgi:hypothetical protein